MSPLVPGAPDVLGTAAWLASLLVTVWALVVWSRGVRQVVTLPGGGHEQARLLLGLAVILVLPVVGPVAFLAAAARRRTAHRS